MQRERGSIVDKEKMKTTEETQAAESECNTGEKGFSVKEAWEKQLERRDEVIEYLRKSSSHKEIEAVVVELRKAVAPDCIGELIKEFAQSQASEDIALEEIVAGSTANMMATLYSIDALTVEAYILNKASGAPHPVECACEELQNLKKGLSEFVREMAQSAVMNYVSSAKTRKNTQGELKRLSESENKSRQIITDLSTQNQRLKDDYSALRKRTEKEKGEIQANASVAIIKSLLPVMENFHHAMSQKDVPVEAASYMQGMAMIERGMWDVLSDAGLKSVAESDVPFDPDKHEALYSEPTEGVEEDTVVEILRPGYIFKDKIIKHAGVKVAVKPSA